MWLRVGTEKTKKNGKRVLGLKQKNPISGVLFIKLT